MLSGISPEIKFDDKFKALRLERRVIEVGIGPLMRLSDKSMNVRFEWKDFGMFPERLAWEMVRETMSCMFPRMTNSPEVETGTEETVMSVRLTRRARESPERRGKEETAEKEWSESGRALRAVEEMERSEEQFVKEREVTRRNGEPVSQVTTVVGGFLEEEEWWWSQGFLRVGMLRDSKALSCFGSSGEVEDVRGGVGEVRGTGEMVGDGVGERERSGVYSG
ncbi:hypothetical protein HID58_001837 [Brassica napus]|uniref:Uncharacterized protein n=2 Tax=Brassica napus TaxID=3708 RepID=A0ABQ8EKI1_BRANA|nr:hypothetical protein HID58_001837 [Brassica napus]